MNSVEVNVDDVVVVKADVGSDGSDDVEDSVDVVVGL